jgi:hypothetical protein
MKETKKTALLQAERCIVHLVIAKAGKTHQKIE